MGRYVNKTRGFWGGAGRVVAYAYVPVLVAVAITRAATGMDLAHQWASSPQLVANGKLWTVFSSALVLDRVQGVQLIAVSVLTVVLLRRHGPGAWWAAVLLGHVGSTLLAYAGTGQLWALGPDAVRARRTPDFGISCVWMTILTFLISDIALSFLRSARAWMAACAAALIATVSVVLVCTSIAEAEHAFAALAGVMTAIWRHRPAPQRASGHTRSDASVAYSHDLTRGLAACSAEFASPRSAA